jgi:hypothetical protein
MITANNANDRQVRLHYVQNVRHSFVLQGTASFLFLNCFFPFLIIKTNKRRKRASEKTEEKAILEG